MGFDLLIFLLVLGLLIFFHELGHFVAAKASGIYVDRFSLGMPPRLFGLKIGETDYCIGALPFGGYVKMAGQEDKPLSDEEREETYGNVPPERWFNNRPLYQRFIVIFAGPAMNFVLAVILYGIVAAIGAQVPETEFDNRIGTISPGSPAANAPMFAVASDGSLDMNRMPDTVGWQVGDRILSIDGTSVTNIQDVLISAVLGAGEKHRVELTRTMPDGSTQRYISPVEPKDINQSGHTLFGVDPFMTALVGQVLPDSPAAAAGLKQGDIILRADDKVIDRESFILMMETLPEGKTVNLTVQRETPDGQTQIFTTVAQPMTIGRFKDVLFAAKEGDPDGRPVVADVAGQAAEKKVLSPGDVVVSVDGQPVTTATLQDLEKQNPGRTFQFTVDRPSILFGAVRSESTQNVELKSEPVRAIGVTFALNMVYHRVPLMQVFPKAFKDGYRAVGITVKTLTELVTGSVSTKELGGPLLIYQATSAAAKEGYWRLFTFTAFISANLCVFNLLPLPVLDGGMLLYLLIEGVRRKPINIKVLERIQQVGLILIMGLLIYVTYNDLTRWIHTRL
jgi:regulator of sigma E protease